MQRCGSHVQSFPRKAGSGDGPGKAGGHQSVSHRWEKPLKDISGHIKSSACEGRLQQVKLTRPVLWIQCEEKTQQGKKVL